MKISLASKETGLSIGAIRHYINLNLVNPKKINSKFDFSKENIIQLEFIRKLKSMGMPVKDIEKVIALRKISNWVEPEDINEYHKILSDHKEKLRSDMMAIKEMIKQADQEINENTPTKERTSTGLPIRGLYLLYCPHCKKPLVLTNAQMDHKYIYQADLLCNTCKYSALVQDGILITDSKPISQYDKPDLERQVYKDNSTDLINIINRSSQWIYDQMIPQNDKVILETNLNSFFFLYQTMDKLGSNNLFIVIDKFKDLIAMFKKNLEYLGLDLDIIYITNNDFCLPIRDKCVDTFIDFSSSSEHMLFNKTRLIFNIHPYLKKDSTIYSVFFSLQDGCLSRTYISKHYPETSPDNFNSNKYLHSLKENGYKIVESENIATLKNTGKGLSFSFHQEGDKLDINAYKLKR
ncbi:MerR family transcriptional regulator [Acidaminobacter sp. JC074]|uniref:MerR family transcriptional regulator n=1 Tax=Acidaminobacter sp. JC074 TaxID=2530199 RepID=UPI001F10A0A3|nr:MerR family transcriptional regulator [Acidaminobacter sp. JC074]